MNIAGVDEPPLPLLTNGDAAKPSDADSETPATSTAGDATAASTLAVDTSKDVEMKNADAPIKDDGTNGTDFVDAIDKLNNLDDKDKKKRTLQVAAAAALAAAAVKARVSDR